MIRFLYKFRYLSWFIKFFLGACLSLIMALSCVAAQSASAADSKHQAQLPVNEIYFKEDSTTPLKAEWLYYPEQFVVHPKSSLKVQRVTLPASFKKISGSNQSYGTFMAKFKIPEAYVGRSLAIFIPNQYGAYRVYINDDFNLRLGEVGKTAQTHQTEKAPRVAFFVVKKPEFTVTIQASNFNNLYGGLENPMRIGLAKTISRQFLLFMVSIGLVCGAVFGLGIFTLMFAVLQRANGGRNRIRAFVFGLFIVFLAFHNLFSPPYAYTAFTNISWIWGARLENLFSYFTIAFFLTYMFLLNWRYLRPPIYAISMLLIVFNTAVTVLTMPDMFQVVAAYSSLFGIVVILNFAYGFYLTLKYKKNYSKINVWAVILLSVTFLHDVLLNVNFIDSFNLSFISTSLYALLIMFQQSRNYAQHAHYIEELNNNLLELNSSLDHKVQQRTQQLNSLNKRLERQVQIDTLTGAFNRHALNAEINRLFTLIENHQINTLAFAMLDVDFFKNYNDFYGHLKGDTVLQDLVQIISQALPPKAYVARYGGEEFAIILHNVPGVVVLDVLQQVLEAVRAAQIEHLNRPDHKPYVTLSMGVAWIDHDYRHANIHELMKAADVQLYAAKHAGRDCCQAQQS